MCVEARLPCHVHVLWLGVAAHGDERDLAELGIGTHRARNLVAIHLGQADVAEHDPGWKARAFSMPSRPL